MSVGSQRQCIGRMRRASGAIGILIPTHLEDMIPEDHQFDYWMSS